VRHEAPVNGRCGYRANAAGALPAPAAWADLTPGEAAFVSDLAAVGVGVGADDMDVVRIGWAICKAFGVGLSPSELVASSVARGDAIAA
jgi:hypothetical protein